jgi:predicted CXXCH cytochrome family protein
MAYTRKIVLLLMISFEGGTWMFLRRCAILLIAAAALAVGLAWAGCRPALAQNPANDTCLACHSQPGMRAILPTGDVLYLTVDPNVYNASVHGKQNQPCIQCHPDVDPQAHPKGEAAWQDLGVRTRRDLSSKLYRDACVKCHPDQYAANLDGAHQKAIAAGDTSAAICTDCHGTHNITVATEPRSKGSQMCERCHSQIFELYKQSVHGSALLGQGNPDVPSCTDCHQVHSTQGPLEDTATSSFRLFSPEICRKCHADAKLMGKYGINADVYDTYVSDFHGTTVAVFEKLAPGQETNKPVCIDCHGVHNMRMVDDPESTVIKENLLVTCQKCHPGATANFPTSWISHYRPDPKRAPLVFFVNLFYWILIPAVLGLMGILVAIDARKRIASRRNKEHQHAE